MKNEKTLFSIGEISRALGVSRRIILHYEECGLIVPDVRNGSGGNRYYSIDTFTRLRTIRSLQGLGLTLAEIQGYLDHSADLLPLIRRLEALRDELDRSIAKLYERSASASGQILETLVAPQRVYRRSHPCKTVAERTVLLRDTALEAMRAHGTDISRWMYFIEYPIAQPDEPSFCVSVSPESTGPYVEQLPAIRGICVYHHGAYEELPAVGQRLLAYAAEHGLTPLGVLRHTYLEGPPQHKDSAKFITQVLLPLREI